MALRRLVCARRSHPAHRARVASSSWTGRAVFWPRGIDPLSAWRLPRRMVPVSPHSLLERYHVKNRTSLVHTVWSSTPAAPPPLAHVARRSATAARERAAWGSPRRAACLVAPLVRSPRRWSPPLACGRRHNAAKREGGARRGTAGCGHPTLGDPCWCARPGTAMGLVRERLSSA